MHRLRYIAGYSWGGLRHPRHSWGVLVAPKWARDCAREHTMTRIWLDNGAFAAWVNKTPMSEAEQIANQLAAADTIGRGRLACVILSDVVTDPVESWRRTKTASGVWREKYPNARRFYAVQENMDVDEVAAAVLADGFAGVFVGGGGVEWKLATAAALRGRGLWIHVGRLSRIGDLHRACALDVTSFDTTSLEREQRYNLRTAREQIIEACCAPASGWSPLWTKAWRG